MTLLSLLACHTLTKTPAATDEGTGACTDPIRVASYGYTAGATELADPDGTSYGMESAPYHVRYSWSGDPAAEATLLWRTDDDTTASRVEYGESSELGSLATGGSFTLLTGGGRIHEVRLCGLKADTTYTYRVGGEEHWSEAYSFTTAPPAGTDVPVIIGLAGDARDNQATWGELLDSMAERGPDFVVFSGDAVDFGGNMDEWGAWLDAGQGFMESHAMVMIHGNHEFYAQNFFGLVAQPGDEKTFSLDYGPLHLSVLDDSTTALDREALAGWLDADLSASAAPWKVVSHHMPAYSSCTTHGSDEELQALWPPVEDKHAVQLDITGHNHNYERSVPLRAGLETAPGKGTVYVVSAGAGADLYTNDMANPFTAVASPTQHYVLITIDGSSSHVEAIDLAGNVLDSFDVPVAAP
ncbi:hypothetical protein LBMAG42_47020 [Deltaproteobacteria bacterium]|nr:hypothetical protein LBMAG42_47020 [Deltaproteobacteria bacterium]